MNPTDVTQTSIDETLKKILDFLKLHETNSGIQQTFYKNDLFRIFADAFQKGLCTRPANSSSRIEYLTEDKIWYYAVSSEWINNDCEPDHRYPNIKAVMTWWQEWTFAWQRYPTSHHQIS